MIDVDKKFDKDDKKKTTAAQVLLKELKTFINS